MKNERRRKRIRGERVEGPSEEEQRHEKRTKERERERYEEEQRVNKIMRNW